MTKCILIDFDGTLSNFEHRRSLYLNGDLEEFYALLHKDKVNYWCKELMEAFFYRGYKIIIVTARPERYRRQSIDWLLRNGIRYHELYMALGSEEQNNVEAKKYIYETKIKNTYQVLFCVEDRMALVQFWRKMGLVCLQNEDGNY